MPRNKPSSTPPSSTTLNDEQEGAVHAQQSTPRKSHTQKRQQKQHQHQQHENVSALTQQLEQVSFDQQQQQQRQTSPHRQSKRKSKPDSVPQQPAVVSNTDTPQSQAQSQTQPKPKRSPKDKVNAIKQFSTPSKSTSISIGNSQTEFPPSNGAVSNGVTNDLAGHYAGPTFHHSPAPSSLPMPSFFASKANMKSALQNGSDLTSPSTQATPIKIRQLADDRDQDDSPLAPFFRADREEKARLRNKFAENGITASPTRPASAGNLSDHAHRSASPLVWQDTFNGVNGRFAYHSLPLDYITDNRSFNI
jgi:hypothetical protein